MTIALPDNPFEVHPSKTIMPGAGPVFYQGGEEAFLFLHGFTGSAYEGRDFAEYFHRQGYAVWVPLLPGHGTAPEDLESVQFREWIAAVEYYYRQMTDRYRTVYVCGQSMGGALALHLAATFPLKAVITLAGAIILKDWRLKLLPVAKHVIRYQFKSKGADIRDKEAKSRSAAYHKYPISSLMQFLQLLEHVRAELPRITSPCLLVHSRRDHTVTFDNLAYISSRISSSNCQTMELSDSYHVISVDVDREKIFRRIESFIADLG